jgi:hypothetical protein
MQIIFNAEAKHKERLQADVDSEVKSRSYATHASSIGDPCLRRLCYLRLKPEAQRRFKPSVKAVLNLGKHLERYIIDECRKSGIDIHQPTTSVQWEYYNIAGTYDGQTEVEIKKHCKTCEGSGLHPENKGTHCLDCEGNGFHLLREWAIVEIKTIKDIYYDQIHRAEDLLRHSWTKKYLIQLLTYIWLQGKRFGVFIFFNKSSGEIKSISLDSHDVGFLALASEAQNNALLVQAYVDYNRGKEIEPELEDRILLEREPDSQETDLLLILPAKINDQSECNPEWCRYHHECLPKLKLDDTPEIQFEPRIFELLDKRGELHAIKSEFTEIDKQVKLWFIPDKGKTIAKWLIAPDPKSEAAFEVTAKVSVNKNGVTSIRRSYKMIGVQPERKEDEHKES